MFGASAESIPDRLLGFGLSGVLGVSVAVPPSAGLAGGKLRAVVVCRAEASAVKRCLDEIAKLRFCPSVTCQLFIPSRAPLESTSAPPLLPGEIGAVCWMISSFSTDRRPDTIPSLIVLLKPLGLPMAYTFSPTRASHPVLTGHFRKGRELELTFSTAMSRSGSAYSNFAPLKL